MKKFTIEQFKKESKDFKIQKATLSGFCEGTVYYKHKDNDMTLILNFNEEIQSFDNPLSSDYIYEEETIICLEEDPDTIEFYGFIIIDKNGLEIDRDYSSCIICKIMNEDFHIDIDPHLKEFERRLIEAHSIKRFLNFSFWINKASNIKYLFTEKHSDIPF